MKKRGAMKLCVAALLACAAPVLGGDAGVRVFVNNREHKLNPPAIARDGKTYVGLRSIANTLNACVKWDAKTRTAMVTVGNKRSRIAQSDGIMVKGALFLPLRAVGEAVGCTVEWDDARGVVRVTSEAPCPTGGG